LEANIFAAVVGDAWRQCRRRPLAIAAIVLLAYLSPGSTGPSQPTREVHGWAAVALLLLVIAASILTAVGCCSWSPTWAARSATSGPACARRWE
jgi:hypothetical protein